MPEPATSARLYFRLLGPPQVFGAGGELLAFRTHKSQAILFYLATTEVSWPRAKLAALLWPEAPTRGANASLRNALSIARGQIGHHLVTTRRSVGLRKETVESDIAHFEALLKRTRAQHADKVQLQTAASLYMGEFLEGFHVSDSPQFEYWATVERERLRDAMLDTLLTLADWQADQRNYAGSLAHLNHYLSLDPLGEVGHRSKMAILAAMGRRNAALLQYEACQRLLREELNVTPEAATIALYELILAGQFSMTGRSLLQLEGASPPIDRQPLAARDRQDEPASSDGFSSSAWPASYALVSVAHQPLSVAGSVAPSLYVDHGEMPRQTAFFGRRPDLKLLARWLTLDRCSIVALTGMGGVGKTALAVELITHIAQKPPSPPASQLSVEADREVVPPFDLIVWRSLINAPSLPELLDNLLLAMVSDRHEALPDSLNDKLLLLLQEMVRRRCLLVLDDAESIMASAPSTGQYRAGYQDYAQLIGRMATGRLRSCLLLITRELLQGLRRLEEDDPAVRIMSLAGLPPDTGAQLLRRRGVTAPDDAMEAVVRRYSGNPLALKLVADTSRDLFGGNLQGFLGEEVPVFDDVRVMLDRQFDRLSDLEQEIIAWLAIEREPVSVDSLWDNLARPHRRRQLLEVTRSLQRNSLVEEIGGDTDREPLRLTLQNVVMEHVTDRLVQTIGSEILDLRFDWLHRVGLVKAHSKEYVQQSQRRLLLKPTAMWLRDQLGGTALVARLQHVLRSLRQEAARLPSYAGANILHLLLYLEADLAGHSFADLAIWQADLRTAALANVDFRGADLTGSVFSETFGIVTALAFSPNGRHLIVGDSQGLAFVWQMDGPRFHMMVDGHAQPVGSLAIAPDGLLFATGGYDGLICVWDVKSGQLVNKLQAHEGSVTAVLFSREGDLVISGGSDSRLVVWDWQGGGLRSLSVDSGVNGLAISQDGLMLACAGSAGEVSLWEWRAGRRLQTLRGHDGKVTAVALKPGGNTVVTGGEDGRICLWRLAEPVDCDILDGHSGWVLTLAFSPDGRSLASGGTDGLLRTWDVESARIRRTLHGHDSWINRLAYSPDGSTLASGGYDQTIRLWHSETGQLLHTMSGHLKQIARVRFSADGLLLASSRLDGPVHLWDVQSQSQLHTLTGHRMAIRAAAFHIGRRLFAGGCDDHNVYLWDTGTGELLRTLSGHDNLVRLVSFCPEGCHLITGSHDQTMRIWDTATGSLCYTVANASATYQCTTVVSSDDGILAYGDLRGMVKLVELASGRVLQSLDLGQEKPTVVEFCPHGPLLACGTERGSICLWNMDQILAGNGADPLHRIQMSTEPVLRLLFSQDCSLLVGYQDEGIIRVIDVESGQLRYAQSVASSPYAVTFDPSGEALITVESTGGIAIRDAATGEIQRALKDPVEGTTSIDASPTAELLASSGVDGIIRLHHLATGEPLGSLVPTRPYAGMNIAGVTGITPAQRAALLTLGAVERC